MGFFVGGFFCVCVIALASNTTLNNRGRWTLFVFFFFCILWVQEFLIQDQVHGLPEFLKDMISDIHISVHLCQVKLSRILKRSVTHKEKNLYFSFHVRYGIGSKFEIYILYNVNPTPKFVVKFFLVFFKNQKWTFGGSIKAENNFLFFILKWLTLITP